MFLLELLEYGGSSLFDISIDLHPTNRSQYLPVVKLPSQSMLPSLTQQTVSKKSPSPPFSVCDYAIW
jgi:hypothetical protein